MQLTQWDGSLRDYYVCFCTACSNCYNIDVYFIHTGVSYFKMEHLLVHYMRIQKNFGDINFYV
jgi:hypothetical protein